MRKTCLILSIACCAPLLTLTGSGATPRFGPSASAVNGGNQIRRRRYEPDSRPAAGTNIVEMGGTPIDAATYSPWPMRRAREKCTD
jgi:hypothetical protein